MLRRYTDTRRGFYIQKKMLGHIIGGVMGLLFIGLVISLLDGLSAGNHAYQCDLFVPSIKTVIECDGCKICNKVLNEWQINQIEEDNIRTKELQEKGFKIIRLKEHEIK